MKVVVIGCYIAAIKCYKPVGEDTSSDHGDVNKDIGVGHGGKEVKPVKV